MAKIDWFDHANAQERIECAERAMLGCKMFQAMGLHWGDGLSVICGGDSDNARRVAEKMHHNMLYVSEHCRHVARRLPIWC